MSSSSGTEQVDGPLYAVSTSVLGQDSATSYLAVVRSLAAGPALDLKAAMEFGGGARAYGPDEGDVVYVTSSEVGTLTEVTFGPDGSPQLGRAVSFANLGIDGTTGGNVHHFVSPSKAYFVSQDTQEIVVWNPEKMAIVRTIPLELGLSPDSFVYFYPRPIVVRQQLVLIANQSDETDIDGPSIVSVIDTDDDRVVSTTVEPNCHSLLQSAVDARGDRYFASSDYSAATYLLAPKQAPAPCMLRMEAGETSFDATWSRTLTEELGTRLWTGVTPGAGGHMYLQGIAEDNAGVVAATEAYEVTIAQPWRWYSLNDGNAGPAPADADFLVSPPLFPPIPVDGNAYVALWDEVDTTLVDLTSAKSPRKSLVVPGFVFNVVRIR